jgi:hypothetical protein
MAGKKANSSPKESGRISRREFGRRAALGAAVAAAASTKIFLPVTASPSARPGQSPPEGPKLSPEARAEVEEKISAIFRKYGAHLSEEQKADVRRLVTEGQEPLETLRAYPLENSNEPATVLRLERKAARPTPPQPPRKRAAASKKRA